MDRGRMTLTTPIKVPDSMPAESVSPKQSQGFVAELFDAITPRTVFLVSGVLLIQLAFVLSYVGAFHHPTPHQVPVVVVAPAQIRATSQPNSAGSTAIRSPPPPFPAKQPG